MAPDPADNEELRFVRAVLAGESRATEAFVERMRCIPRFLNHRNRQLGRPLASEDVADLSQEVFALLWSKLGEFRCEARLETWAYRFCERKILERLRGSRAAHELDEHQTDGSLAQPGERLDRGIVLAALEALPRDELSVVIAKHFEELSFESIGARQGASVSTVKARYYRAIERMRTRLGPAFRGVFGG